jgi:hypothetical protein
MVAIYFFEKSVYTISTLPHIPEGDNPDKK